MVRFLRHAFGERIERRSSHAPRNVCAGSRREAYRAGRYNAPIAATSGIAHTVAKCRRIEGADPEQEPILEIEGGSKRPHRAPVARKKPTDESPVVVVEVEERIAVVAVETEMSAGQDLEAACQPNSVVLTLR